MVEVLKVILLCFIPLIINYYLTILCYCIMCINRVKKCHWFFLCNLNIINLIIYFAHMGAALF